MQAKIFATWMDDCICFFYIFLSVTEVGFSVQIVHGVVFLQLKPKTVRETLTDRKLKFTIHILVVIKTENPKPCKYCMKTTEIKTKH